MPEREIKRFSKPKSKTSYFQKASFKTADLKLKPEDLRFDYIIQGDSPIWRPTPVFDDGKQTFIQFPKSLTVSEAPPLFVTDRKGKKSKFVNCRVKGECYAVDVSDIPMLEQILPDMATFPCPFWLVTHRKFHTSRRIRLVYDHFSEELKAPLRNPT